MARPQKARKMRELPSAVMYSPAGWASGEGEAVEIAIEDFEMMRLVDGRGFHLVEAAEKMGVSRSTAGRMLERARRGIAMGIEQRVPLCLDAGEELIVEPELKWSCGLCESGAVEPRGGIAVACCDDDLSSPVEKIFGRSPGFVLVPKVGAVPRYVESPGFGVKRNAADLTVAFLKKQGVTRVVAGRFGSHALELLAKNNLQAVVAGGLHLGQAITYFE
ncbi:DUF134 domain-containing protein [Kiritimatiellota bacterium B12222]|nr:DUF134 domain-containing protein [Kiritimatiellota bacterium B12222]